MFQSIIGELLITLISSSVWIIMFILLKKTLFKNYTKSFNYSIWLFIIIRMLCPINITINISNYINISRYSTNILYVFIRYIEEMGKKIQEVGASKEIGYIWVAGIVFLSFYRGIRYIKIKNKVLKSSYLIEDKKVLNTFIKLRKELGIEKEIRLLGAETDLVPFGIGVFKSYIILPNYKFDSCELEWILRHELIHIKYNDIFYKFLLMLVSIIYWFNPLVYYMNNIINDECELACDERVLRNCNVQKRQDYALAIIKSVKRFKESETKMVSALGKECFVKERVENMFQYNLKRGFFTIIILFLVTVFSIINFNVNGNYNVNQNIIQQQLIENDK